MSRHGLDEATAFERLRRTARSTRQTVDAVAREVVASAVVDGRGKQATSVFAIAAEGGADCRSAKNAARPMNQSGEAHPLGAAAPLPEGASRHGRLVLALLLEVVADYRRPNAVLTAGRTGGGRASGPQYPGLRIDRFSSTCWTTIRKLG